MAGKNILTIDISNIDFNATKFKMVGSLTLDKVKIKYNWIFNANIKDAIIGEDENGLVWYSGTWVNGTWENGTWYSGIFLEGRWKAGNVYSYDIDINQLMNGVFYIYRTDISKTHFVNCSFEGGNFNYGIFGNIKNSEQITLPYLIDREFILNNIEDYDIDNGFNVGAKIGFELETSISDTMNVVNTIAFDSNNKTIVGGNFSKYNNLKCNSILRLENDGTVSSNFNGGFNTDATIKKIIVDSENKILIGGDFSTFNNEVHNNIIRLNSDETIDNNFFADFPDVSGTTQYVNTIAVDSDNKILVGGNILAYNNNYKYDSTLIGDLKYVGFYNINSVTFNNIVKVSLLGEVGITVGKKIYFYETISKILKNIGYTVLDVKIEDIGSQKYTSLYIRVVNFDKVTVYSDKSFYIKNNISNILRLNYDGSIDTTFITNGFDGIIKSIKIDNNNKILVGGEFVMYSGVLCGSIIRLNQNGTVDETFNKSFGFSGSVNAIEVDTNDNIYIGGQFLDYSYSGDTYLVKNCNNLIKITNEGSVDEDPLTVFKLGDGITYNATGTTAYVNTITIDSNGKILLGGHFDAYNSKTAYGVVRINSDGTTDETFVSGYGIFNNQNSQRNLLSSVNIATVDFENKIYLGGSFDIYNETKINLLVRTNSVGKIDNINNKRFKTSEINKAKFKKGTFINGLFNSAQFIDGNFINGYFNNSLWNNGNWYNGEFLGGEWYNGEFLGGVFSNGNWYGGFLSKINKDLDTNFGLNYKNKTINAANWYDGIFSNGKFYSVKYETLDATQALKQGVSLLRNTDNSLVNWYNGTFSNGNFYGGRIHNAIWDNGIMYDGHILYITFNNGHIVDTFCEGGIFNNGTVGGGIFDNIIVNNLYFGYEIN